MMMTILQVGGGLVLLLVGGEFLVRASVSLADRLGVSPLVIGLTVVAAGTSAPELLVSLIAALDGVPGIAVGNVIGSNIANILLILGVAGLIHPIEKDPRSLYRNGGIAIAATVAFVVMCLSGTIVAWHGILLLIGLFTFITYSYWIDRRDRRAAKALADEVQELGLPTKRLLPILLLLAVGLAAVLIGAELLVEGAVVVARSAGISETVIGLTLVALGTSLPELATAGIAAYRRHTDLALGNALGSNIFNVLAIMGTVSVVTPVEVPAEVNRFDLWAMLAVIVGFVLIALAVERIRRPMAVAFLLVYASYIYVQFA